MDPFTIFVTVVSIISGVASYQQAKKIQREVDRESRGVEANIESNIKAIPVVYGERRVGGARVYIDTSKDIGNKYLYMVMAMAEGEIEDIHSIEIDDTPITDEKFILSGLGANFTYEIFYGSDTQDASDLIIDGVAYSNSADVPPEVAIYLAGQESDKPWNQNHKLNGVAYLAMRFLWDSNAYNGVPNVTAIVKGKKVYDPRNPTAPKAWSNNPALCIRDYLTSSRYGKGIPDSAINDTMFSQAANDYDAFVVTPYDGGDDITLFELNTVIDTEVKIINNLNDMLMSCRGFLPYVDGKYGIRVDKATNHVMDVSSDHIIGGISIAGTKKEDRFNQVKVNFFNKDKEYKEDTAVFPDVDDPSDVNNLYQQYLAEDGGEPLVDDIKIDGISNYYTAREMAKLFLLRSRLGTAIAFRGTSELMELEVGDTFLITQPTPAWTNKKFQVQEIGLNFDGTVNIQAIEYSDAIYTYNTASEETPFVPTKLPNPNKLAPVTALSASAGTDISADGKTISFIDLSWTAPNDALVDRYEIKYTIDDETSVVYSAVAIDQTHRIVDAEGSYDIEVYAVNGFGAKSTGVTLSNVLSVTDTTAPAEPTGFNVVGELHQILLSWTNPSDDDFDKVRIKSSTQNDESTSIVIAELKGDSYIDSGYTGVVTKYYWAQSIDRTGNASDYVYAGTGTTSKLVSADFSDGLIDINYLDTSTQTIINSVADYDTDISNINTSITNINTDITNLDADVNTRALESDFQNVTQRLDDTLDLAGERLLSMSLFASEQAQIMRDAGVTVDPDNGSVTIQAVEALRSDVDSSFNQVNIELDAQEATINLKASTAYVNNAIASAVLDSADLASLNDLEAKVAQAEIDIDGNTASILLKADQTEIDSLDIRVAQAEIDIDGAEASIALKANQTDFTSLQTRVGDAEIVINALDVPSITQTVSDVSNLNHRVNAAEVQDIKQLLEIYDTRQVLQQDIAFARTQITADTLETRESIATQKTELLARIDDNQASIISETTARANADTAITEDITQLQADLSTSDGNIAGNATAITALDGRVTINEGEITSQASEITRLQSSVTDLETDTNGNATAITNLDTRVTSNETSISSQATSITQIESDITDLGTDTSTNATAISGLDTRVTQTETDITSQATAITSLTSDVGDLQTNTGANATAVTNLDTRVTANEASITSQSTSITNLESSITDLETDTGNNATAISQLSTTVTQNGVDITAVSQDLTNLTTTVGDNTADIIEVSEVTSSETRASAKRLEQLVTGQAETQLTEILNREDNQTFLNAEIAVVRSDFNAVTTENRESIAQTRTDLVALIDNNASSITSEQLARASADQSLASDITSLRSDLTVAEGDIVANANATSLITTRVTNNEGDISSISADVTTLQADLNLAEGGIVANGLAVTALDTRVTSAEGIITSHSSDITTLESDVVSLQTDTTGNATAITNLDTRVTATETTTTSNATSITSLESDVGDLQTDTSGNATAITGLDTRVTNAEGSITTNATAITGLTTTVSGHTTSIAENLSSIDGVKAQYSVTVNNNGTISGFGLVSDLIDGEVGSAFAVSADQFYLTGDVNGSLWNVETRYYEGDVVTFYGRTYIAKLENIGQEPDNFTDKWDDITSIPFAVYTVDTQVTKNGETTTIPAGVYIQDAYIQNLSVGTDIIQGSAVTTDKIENLAINNAKIKDAAITTAKIGDAQITNAKIFDLNADKITAGTISTSRLNIDGVTLDTNDEGKLIISEGGVGSTEIAENAVSDSATAYTAGNIELTTDYTTIQSASVDVDPISRDLVTISFRVVSMSLCNIMFRIVKTFTFGSPPTPVEIEVVEIPATLASVGSNLYSYSVIDTQSGLSESVTYKVEAKITFAVSNVVNATSRSLTVMDLRR